MARNNARKRSKQRPKQPLPKPWRVIKFSKAVFARLPWWGKLAAIAAIATGGYFYRIELLNIVFRFSGFICCVGIPWLLFTAARRSSRNGGGYERRKQHKGVIYHSEKLDREMQTGIFEHD